MLSFHSVLRIVKFLKRDVGVFFSTDDDVLAAGCHGAVSHWLQWSFGDAFNPLKKGFASRERVSARQKKVEWSVARCKLHQEGGDCARRSWISGQSESKSSLKSGTQTEAYCRRWHPASCAKFAPLL